MSGIDTARVCVTHDFSTAPILLELLMHPQSVSCPVSSSKWTRNVLLVEHNADNAAKGVLEEPLRLVAINVVQRRREGLDGILPPDSRLDAQVFDHNLEECEVFFVHLVVGCKKIETQVSSCLFH
jgi:hypothetical protein